MLGSESMLWGSKTLCWGSKRYAGGQSVMLWSVGSYRYAGIKASCLGVKGLCWGQNDMLGVRPLCQAVMRSRDHIVTRVLYRNADQMAH